jgi:hypothetical protein
MRMHCPLPSSVRDLYAVSDTANLKHAQMKPHFMLTAKKMNCEVDLHLQVPKWIPF